ncbi:MAG: pyridoxamine 5'-phosphate oxidase family protein [Solirubrobacterales bacterium]
MNARPDLVSELLEGPYPCCLTTLRAEGDPYAVVVWCAPEGERVTVNATEGRWLANIRRDPRVSLVIVDPAEILRHVGIDGRVVAIEPDRDHAHIDSLSQLYEGRPYAYSTSEEEPHFKLTIEPLRIRAFDLSGG